MFPFRSIQAFAVLGSAIHYCSPALQSVHFDVIACSGFALLGRPSCVATFVFDTSYGFQTFALVCVVMSSDQAFTPAGPPTSSPGHWHPFPPRDNTRLSSCQAARFVETSKFFISRCILRCDLSTSVSCSPSRSWPTQTHGRYT